MRLNVHVYRRSTGDYLPGAGGVLSTNIEISRMYPGGIDVEAAWLEAVSPRLVSTPIRLNDTVKIYYGAILAWEGVISDVSPRYSDAAYFVKARGYWADRFTERLYHFFFADRRLTDTPWVDTSTLTGFEKCDVDTQGEVMRFVPKNTEWTTGNQAIMTYFPPNREGQTIRRISFSYDLTTGGGSLNWTLQLYDQQNAASVWSVNRTTAGSSTGSQDLSVTGLDFSSTNELRFRFYPGSYPTTPPDGGQVYAEISDLRVWEYDDITPDFHDMAPKITGKVPEVSTSTFFMDSSLTLDLDSYVTPGWVSLARAIEEIAAFGDASANPIGYGLKSSEYAAAADAKPVFFSEVQPDTEADYDYRLIAQETVVNYDERLSDVRNYMIVEFQDVSNRKLWRTADLTAAYSNAASIELYGQRDLVVAEKGLATADPLADKTLALRKDPHPVFPGGVQVSALLTKEGGYVPAALIMPGKRLLVGLNRATGLKAVALITGVRYNDVQGMASLTFGAGDRLAVMLKQLVELADPGS